MEEQKKNYVDNTQKTKLYENVIFNYIFHNEKYDEDDTRTLIMWII